MDEDQNWTELKPLAEKGDVDGMLTEIRGIEDDGERISLYRLAIRKLAFDEWRNKNLDVMTGLADAAIEDCELLGGDFLQQANVICYNTSANLCDCWGDDFQREPRHFEKGIEYAKKALWFREHVSKGPGALAMATWAVGKHEQSLGRLSEATDSFRRCLDLERQAATLADAPTEVSADAPEGLLIAAGYLALMENDRDVLNGLWSALNVMEERGGDARDDAQIIRAQLQVTAGQLGVDLPA